MKVKKFVRYSGSIMDRVAIKLFREEGKEYF